MDDKLKPCPFCGIVPRLYWESWKEISETSGIYVLEADHRKGCFIRSMNGTSRKGRMSSCNKKSLIEAWSRRTSDDD